MVSVTVDALTQAIFDRLAGDAVLDGLLARTIIGDGAGPAVYTTIPVPPEAELPYVVAYGPISNEPDDAAQAAQFRAPLTWDIHSYAARPRDGGGSVSVVNAIAGVVWGLFHQKVLDLPLEGPYAKNLNLLASGPVVNDGPQAFGRVVTLHMRVAVAPS